MDVDTLALADALAQKCAGCGLPLSADEIEDEEEICSLCAFADNLERASDAAIDEELYRASITPKEQC